VVGQKGRNKSPNKKIAFSQKAKGPKKAILLLVHEIAPKIQQFRCVLQMMFNGRKNGALNAPGTAQKARKESTNLHAAIFAAQPTSRSFLVVIPSVSS
jgi:hypothetical protein